MYKDSNPWGGIILSRFDTTGKLKSPGGEAKWIWFPKAANLKLGPGIHSIKVVVDSGKILTEVSETNNSLTRRLVCRIRKAPPDGAPAPPSGLRITETRVPEKIKLLFSQSQLTYNKQTKKVTWYADGFQISPGDRIEVCELTPSIYHLRHAHWPKHIWQIDLDRKKVYRISDATACQQVPTDGSGERWKVLPTVVVGSPSSSTFALKFQVTHLIFFIDCGVIRVFGENNVMGFEYEWKKRNLPQNVFHLGLKLWVDHYYWEISLPQRKVWRVDGPTFGSEDAPASNKQELSIQVIPEY
jgi:hypothetical protein